MAQFYFLSVLFNIIVGLVLMYGRDLTVYSSAADGEADLPATTDAFDTDDEDSFGDIDDEESDTAPVVATGGRASLENFSVFNNRTFRLVTGILSIFVAIIKLLSPMDVPFIGDILPALAGMLGGFAFLVEYDDVMLI